MLLGFLKLTSCFILQPLNCLQRSVMLLPSFLTLRLFLFLGSVFLCKVVIDSIYKNSVLNFIRTACRQTLWDKLVSKEGVSL